MIIDETPNEFETKAQTATRGRVNELRAKLGEKTMAELRTLARTTYNVALSRDDSKEDIIRKIISLADKVEFAQQAYGDLKPGWARIRVSPSQGRPAAPVYVCVNDYDAWVPMGVEVDVPIKLVEVLQKSTELQLAQNEFGEDVHVEMQTYPTSVIAINPGPDPRPGIEVTRARKLVEKYEFRDEKGYWPNEEALKEWRKEKTIQKTIEAK